MTNLRIAGDDLSNHNDIFWGKYFSININTDGFAHSRNNYFKVVKTNIIGGNICI